MRHFLNTYELSDEEMDGVLEEAARFKKEPLASDLRGRSIGLVFFNPSLRTRSSFEIGAHELGGHAVVVQPGRDAWAVEIEAGAVMDGEAEEHVQELVGVLSRYCSLLGVRAFPRFRDWSYDRADPVLQAFVRHSKCPVINLETITHPCQELAHALTLRERLESTRGKKYLLTWTYHPRPLNTAVANSALLIATRLGFEVTLLIPTDDYLLDEHFLEIAHQQARRSGGSLSITTDLEAAYDGAEVVYAKSWGALPFFGRWDEEKSIRDRFRHFIVDESKMSSTRNALFGHCLPLRRNVKATDAVVDSDRSIVLAEAENRLPVQKAVMRWLLRGTLESSGSGDGHG